MRVYPGRPGGVPSGYRGAPENRREQPGERQRGKRRNGERGDETEPWCGTGVRHARLGRGSRVALGVHRPATKRGVTPTARLARAVCGATKLATLRRSAPERRTIIPFPRNRHSSGTIGCGTRVMNSDLPDAFVGGGRAPAAPFAWRAGGRGPRPQRGAPDPRSLGKARTGPGRDRLAGMEGHRDRNRRDAVLLRPLACPIAPLPVGGGFSPRNEMPDTPSSRSRGSSRVGRRRVRLIPGRRFAIRSV